MRRLLGGLFLFAFVVGCDKPGEVYQGLPDDFDPVAANGQGPIQTHFTGTKGFGDESAVSTPSVPTTEVCTTTEVAVKQAEMVNFPILPMKGAGGLDMTGGPDWKGLTIDEVQSKDGLCQAVYYGDGVAAWGDNYELIAFFDPTTRLIDDIALEPGYLGTIQAGAYELALNEPITKNGVPLSADDGSDNDPRSENALRALDRALIAAFRPSLDASQVDCVESGSCYIIMSGTEPVLVFMSVGLYVVLEPEQKRISWLEVTLKRAFRLDAGRIEVDGLAPTIYGTDAAGIPDCKVSYGTSWKHIREKCLADDPMAMATVQTANGLENVTVNFGGVYLYFERKGLAVDQVLPLAPTLDDGDTVAIVSANAGYEGEFSMPYSDVLRIFQANVDKEIRKQVPGLPHDASTGVDLLRTPDDPALPVNVQHSYPDRLRPGGIYAAFCTPELDHGKYATCYADASGRPTLPLTNAMQQIVAGALGEQITPTLSQPSFYVQQFEEALFQYFNAGPVLPEQMILSADTGEPDRIYATATLFVDDVAYTVNVYYGGNDDRMHFLNFQKGASRMEAVLLQDAGLPNPTDPEPSGVFTLQHLLYSPRMGLGAVGTIAIDHQVPETRRALLNVAMSDTETVQVVAPYLEASDIAGYWRPTEGPQDTFVPSHVFSLYGNTISASFYLAPVAPDAPELEVVAIAADAFFGETWFCGLQTTVGAYASDLLAQIEADGYPCPLIIRRTPNREFVEELIDLDTQRVLRVSNDMVTSVMAWLR